MYRYLESVKLSNGEFYRLDYHQKRVNSVFAECFPMLKPFRLSDIILNANFPKAGVFKCRVLYRETVHELEFVSYEMRKINSLKLLTVETPLLNFKTEDRSVIQNAYKERKNADDILMLVNGLITDTSYANVAFLKQGIWYTPAKPYLEGTQRAALIHDAKITLSDIREDEIFQFEKVRIFNAMIEFGELELPVSAII